MSDMMVHTLGEKAMGSRANEHFPSPWYDYASMVFPNTIQDALRACEDILSANGTYREALRRIISYFVTDVEVTSTSGDILGTDEKDKYETFLDDIIGVKKVLMTVAMDFLTYGNSFTSLIIPFRRYLSCPSCGLEAPLRRIYNTPEFKFSWVNFEFHAECPQCGHHGKFNHIDRRSHEQDSIHVKRWNPHEIDILWDPYTDETSYIWKIPEEYRSLIRRGHLFHLERASWEIIQAVKNNQYLLFDKDVVYHMKEEALAGIRNRGWGISRVLANFRQAFYVQVLHRYNEAIALDYVIPFRVITPQARQGEAGGAMDPALSIGMGGFVSRVQSMIGQRRRDPARWNILPFPIEYQALGGDATQLAPKDLLEFGMNNLLAAVGIPVEMYQGNMSMQTAMPMMRMFEAYWAQLTHYLNQFLSKLVEKIAQLMSWEPVTCKLQRTKHADDLNRQMAQLQLMMGGQISKTTGLKALDMEFLEEVRRKLQEQKLEQEETQKIQKQMEQASVQDEMAQGGGQQQQQQGMQQPGMQPGMDPSQQQQMGPMGQPMGPGGAAQGFAAMQPTPPNQPTTPEEMQNKAQTIAEQAMMMPESQKDSFLIQLKKTDPTMSSLVRSILEGMRRDAARQGQDMVMQQQFGQGGGGGDPSQGGAKQGAARLPRGSARRLYQCAREAGTRELRSIEL
jgi:hypothetical protein